jgi:serine/threonine protein kinase
MESDPRISSGPESADSAGLHRTGVLTGGVGALHQPRRYATVVPSESFGVPFKAGEVLGGKYRVLELLGVGGVGFVVAAMHLGLDNQVALKFLKPEFVSNPEALRSFTLEARASFKIKSEHIARVHDVDALPNGMPFMVMELLNGQDVRRILQRRRFLPVERAVDFALQSCDALAAAHAMQIVHRDVKPENLFVIGAGEACYVKMLDFGIARVSAATSSQRGVTASMVAVGTPPYMSPEQIRGSRNLDARADQWSLGCVLYELLTGISPFSRLSIMQSCAAVLEEAPAPLREARSEVPEALERVVLRCLEKSPADRFEDIADLARALAPFSRHYAYYAERCGAVLAQRPALSTSSIRRVERPSASGSHASSPSTRSTTSVPVTRVPTGTYAAPSNPAKRFPTMNPLAEPTAVGPQRGDSRPPPAARMQSVVESPMPLAIANVELPQETTDVSDIPGLKPKRGRFFFFAAAAASIAFAVAYSMT